MPSSRISNNWSLSEVLGQRRRLLGLGALLAWLVLFHLLVNVWLLCVFTSLLVALGGWLGSRAILDANSLLHLEHFLPLGGATPPQCSAEHEWRLNHEIHCAVHKAVRDFVSSWYRTLLPEVEGEFERAVRNSMLDSVMELKERARRVDRKALVQRLLEVYGCHLQSYMTARHMQLEKRGENVSLWQLYQEVDSPHPAVSDAAAELSYARALVNLVLHVLVPYPQMETRTGGYMVTELITCNVLLPLISRVSDPDWLNQTIVDVFTRSQKPQDTALYGCALHDSWMTCLSSSEQASLNSESNSDLLSPISEEDSSQCSMLSLETCSGRDENCHPGLLTPCKVNCCSLTSGHFSHLQESKMHSLDSLTQSNTEDDVTKRLCECGPSTNFCNTMNLRDDADDFGCFAPLKNLGPKVVVPVESHWPAGIAQEKSPAGPSSRLCLNPLNFDTPTKPTVDIQNVQIAGTVTAKEQRGTGTHPYTLYTITFETATCPENSDPLQPATCHTVNRRYSEFLNLQTRLEENPEVKKFVKNVKGPKKMFPDLPFGNTDWEKVEARKGQLDTFLKQLNSIPETARSEDMQEFLSLNSGVCTYFGKKPFVKSRIDKMMENALDTLKTAFPHPEAMSPTDDLEGDSDGRTLDNRKYRRLMFPSKVSPSLNIPDLHPKVTYCFSEGSPVLNGMSLSRLENFVLEQERLLCKEQAKQSEPLGTNKTTGGKTHSPDTAVADVALNILCLLMKDQWRWLCTENIQKAIRLIFGTFIERWMDVGVTHLTSAPCWVIYLQVLQEAVWPGGTLPAQPQPERSPAEREETKERCLECLMQLLPELIADMLGSDKYRLSLETMLESLQDHHINKHLIYCICDLLLEFLIPESSDDSFQRSLLHNLCKDTPT
ncbi:sorting nexin-19a [Corythoichthys intestinalis]|uniref:sorting nexin-19a n=1 Tax=Corythoichthys intestinalis TaxID=161448 RepID=UPI0025A52010|nr:sorting nexin-19-like [Corythoichthys intestinalis]XP_057676664.1 sorting nexin-19-like [Corythoichthys intestinalis]XP_057676665.1 sorting nexin-19-like [Corythoichthys intestinalis]XP_057676666.1 sorting nexin-19-like [Corythoichthys intestinalis]XP_061801548.1 sorting nexin-19-like [Nerophis lumbriciformis]